MTDTSKQDGEKYRRSENRGYLMQGSHWRIGAVTDLSRVFRSLPTISPEGSFLAVAECAWPSDVQAALALRATAGALEQAPLPIEFERAFALRITPFQMAELAVLADDHAEPEIAMHIAAFNARGTWLEWFDLPGDPIAVSVDIPREAVERFAHAIGGECEALNGGMA